jgi:hypothetical protein
VALPHTRARSRKQHVRTCRSSNPLEEYVFHRTQPKRSSCGKWILWAGALTDSTLENEISPMLYLTMKPALISVDKETLRTRDLYSQNIPCSTKKCHYILCWVCGVLWVQLKLLSPFFWEHKYSPMCHIYTGTIVERFSDGGRTYSTNFPNKRTQQLTALTVLCVMILLVGHSSKQEFMAPSFSRPDRVHFLRSCVWNDKMHSDIYRTEGNWNERIQVVMSPISPAELRLAMNGVFSN